MPLMLGFKKNTGINDKIQLRLPNGELITVIYFGCKQNVVTIGVEAPKDVKVFREKADGTTNEK